MSHFSAGEDRSSSHRGAGIRIDVGPALEAPAMVTKSPPKKPKSPHRGGLTITKEQLEEAEASGSRPARMTPPQIANGVISDTVPSGVMELDPLAGACTDHDEILLKSFSFHSQFDVLKKNGATDDELLVEIRSRWRMSPVHTKPPYVTTVKDPTWGTAIWIGSSKPNGIPTYSGDSLLTAVRRVLGIAERGAATPNSNDHPVIECGACGTDVVAAFSQLKAKGKSRAKAAAKIADAETPSAGDPQITVLERGVSIPLTQVDDSPYQTRGEPSVAEILELMDSLISNTQLTAIRVRRVGERYQLIAGHRRARAARRAGWTLINADVIECPESTAATEVFEENDKHKPLNAIERARGLKVLWEQYQAEGRPQGELAAAVGFKSQSSVSNLIRLLSAPEPLQQRLISGDISQEQLRALSAWSDRPKLVETFTSELANRVAAGPVDDSHWNSALRIAIERHSRPITRREYDPQSPQFDCSKHDDLEILEYSLDGRKHSRAFNVKRWKQLQEAAKKRKAEQEPKSGPSTKTSGASSSAASSGKTDTKSHSFQQRLRTCFVTHYWKGLVDRLTSSKISKPDKLIVARLAWHLIEDSPPYSIDEALSMSAEAFAAHVFTLFLKSCDPTECPYQLDVWDLETLTHRFTPDADLTWQPSRELLDACGDKDLSAMATECNCWPDVDAENVKRDELIDALHRNWSPGWIPKLFQPPKNKAKKAVRLT